MREQEKTYNVYRYVRLINELGYYMRAENIEEAVNKYNIVIGLIDEYIWYLKRYKEVKERIEKDMWTIGRFEEEVVKALKENKQDEWDKHKKI